MGSAARWSLDSKICSVPLKTISTIVLLCCSLGVFLTYLVPEWRVFFSSKVFAFANAWDEPTYLSWQGTIAAQNTPGNFSLHLSAALQRLGLSGALQNLVLDTILPPSTALLVFLTLRLRQVEPIRAVAYATLICFGSVLFNANNPLISNMLGETRSATIWIMSGWEVYASILRTPNPEIPFFLVAYAVYGFVRFNRWWILLLPLPLLYYHTAVPYAFLLVLGLSYQQLHSRYLPNCATALLAASALTMVVMGGGLVIMSYLIGLYQPDHSFRQQPYIFSATRQPQFPVGLLAMAPLFAAGIYFRLLQMNRSTIASAAVIAIAALGSVNLHIATGFMLSQKNYYDYGLSVFFPLLLVIAIEAIRFDIARAVALAGMLILVVDYSYRSQLYWLQNASLVSQELAPEIDRLRRACHHPQDRTICRLSLFHPPPRDAPTVHDLLFRGGHGSMRTISQAYGERFGFRQGAFACRWGGPGRTSEIGQGDRSDTRMVSKKAAEARSIVLP
jgi:hypothetical protein